MAPAAAASSPLGKRAREGAAAAGVGGGAGGARDGGAEEEEEEEEERLLGAGGGGDSAQGGAGGGGAAGDAAGREGADGGAGARQPASQPASLAPVAYASSADASFWPSRSADASARAALEAWASRALPARLLERCRVARAAGGPPAARAASSRSPFVLYWARGVALRSSENPALSCALALAAELRVPLVALFALPERGSTARRHAFLLEGWADVERALRARGVAAACAVARPGARAPHHLALACRAALVVSDEPWTAPMLEDARALAAMAGQTAAPLILVDTQCVVPARAPLPRGADLRAYAYEAATKAARAARVEAPYEEVAAAAAPPLAPADEVLAAVLPGFAPDDVSTPEAIAALVAAADVDQSVRPAAHTRGGERAAARRWRAWLAAGGLRRYAARRNDPLDGTGGCRMSAYLNAGMASPFAVARDAATAKGAGAGRRKFLLELQTWRELSYAFVLRRPATHATLDALPPWAQRTLREHATDPRPRGVLPLGALEAGRTGQALWDAMQLALVESGEMHNNVRMTWGKAVHEWSASPAEALARLIHLNNRYALDGHAPPSYGGILWCFGGFDSAAKGGETHAVTGAIKARPIERHARRLDPAALLRAARERNGVGGGGRGGGASGGVVGMLRRAADLNARSAAALPAPASG